MELNRLLGLLARDPTASIDLAEAALRLAEDEYPDLDVEAYLSELDGMAKEAHTYVRGNLQAKVAGLARYLFHEMGFRGNTKNYYDARNSYLNDVLDRRTGIPISLSVVAIAIGQRVGLNIFGVGLPGHFVAKAVADGQEVVFDPFHGGRSLSVHDCENLVRQVTTQPFQADTDSLQAVSPGFTVQRMLNNLKGVYVRVDDYGRAIRVIHRLRQLLPDDPVQRRDLGACLFQTGHPGQAIDHLKAYLADTPNATDVTIIRQLLTQAQDQVAKWN